MVTPRPPKGVLSERQRAEFERLVRAYTTGQQLALRARIVLLAGDEWSNLQIARELGVDDETPGHRRRRWLQFQDLPLEELVSLNGWPTDHDQAHRRSSHLSRCARSSLWPVRSQPTPADRSANGATASWRMKSYGEGSSGRSGRGMRGGCSKEADLKPHLIRYWLTPAVDEAPESAMSGSLTYVPCTAKRYRMSQMANE
jgi:hypothetical protein